MLSEEEMFPAVSEQEASSRMKKMTERTEMKEPIGSPKPKPGPRQPRPSLVFLCTHNSARSQMAEVLAREDFGSLLEAHSAGVVAHGVHPMALDSLHRAGLDCSGLESKTIDSLTEALRASGRDVLFDVVVTVCDNAREACPFLPARRLNLHQRFEDPSALDGSAEERQLAFDRVRDEIRLWLREQVPVWFT